MGSSEENSISKIPIGQVETEAPLLQPEEPEAGLGFEVSASIDSAEPPVRTSYDLDELPTALATQNQQCDGHLSSESKEDADEELQYQRAIIEGIQNFVLEERERESKEDADHEEYIEVVEEDYYNVYADHGKHEIEDAQGDNGFEEGSIGENLIEEYGEEDGYADEVDGTECPELEVSKHVKYNRPTYPVRRFDAEDCAHYMRTGTCKFGSCCKFNHPPSRKNQASKDRWHDGNSERIGQIECKYYLMPGGCKYGNTCKFKHDGGNTPYPSHNHGGGNTPYPSHNHGGGNTPYPSHNHGGGEVPFSPMVQFNFMGLPVNQEEKDCPYYMRTGTCKYGANCRFNHPDPSSAGKGDLHSGYNAKGSVSQGIIPRPTQSSWSAPNETGLLPTMFPPRQLASVGPQWNSFQAPNVYPTSGSSLPIPPALALSNSMPDTNFHMYHNQQQIVATEYPERPGQPECSYFMKTGSCKYKFSCKFHHPRHQFPKITNGAHNEKGLPLRPDRPICTHYGRYGICKSGPACEYDHPANYNQPASSSSMNGLDTQFGNMTVNYRENGSYPGGYFIKPQIQQSF